MSSLDLPLAFLDVFPEKIFAPIVAGIFALLITMFATPYVRRLALAKGAVDNPKRDDRRIHVNPTPKWGGFALYLGIFLSVIVVLLSYFGENPFPSYVVSMIIGSTFVLVVGTLDDLYHFSAKIQFLFLLVLGFAVQYFSGPDYPLQIKGVEFPLFFTAVKSSVWIPFHALSWPFTALYILVVTKTMDTIDGLDGLATGIALIAAVTLAILGIIGLELRMAVLAAATAGAAAGFLRYNFNPAKIFVGTGGSQLLGFILACMSIIGAFKAATAMAIAVPLFIFGVPLFDAALVVIRRLLARQPVTQGGKRHIHHTLINFGLSQRQAVMILYLVALILCASLLVLLVSF